MSGSSDDGFLSRWSRRKREAAQTDARADEAGLTPSATGTLPSRAGALAETMPAAEPSRDERSPEDELAQFDPATLEIPLPSLEDLKPGDSLKAFMQRGVPELIRNAALRKMWALDPMVRDFRSEALDYAYDWNAPGGIPGISEPLAPNDRVSEMVDALFRSHEGQGEVELFDQPDRADEAETEPLKDWPIGDEIPERTTPGEPLAEGEPRAEMAENKAFEAEKPSERVEMPRKRHGGAMPQV